MGWCSLIPVTLLLQGLVSCFTVRMDILAQFHWSGHSSACPESEWMKRLMVVSNTEFWCEEMQMLCRSCSAYASFEATFKYQFENILLHVPSCGMFCSPSHSASYPGVGVVFHAFPICPVIRTHVPPQGSVFPLCYCGSMLFIDDWR